jgi:HipA-like protein
MRRTRKSGVLGLWMNGQRVGSWRVTAQGKHQLHYDETWLASPLGRPLSLSLPLRPASAPYQGERVRNYFENLLPDNDHIRQRLARRFSTGTDAFRLLAEISRDCVGALQILPDGESPPATEALPCAHLSRAQVAQHLADTLPHSGVVLDAGSHRWPRQEFQCFHRTRRLLPSGTALRRAFRAFGDGPWGRSPFCAKGQNGHGNRWQKPALQMG